MSAARSTIPPHLKIEIFSLQAQIAFCDALLTFIGTSPDSPHQQAQVTVFKTLERILGSQLKEVRRKARGVAV